MKNLLSRTWILGRKPRGSVAVELSFSESMMDILWLLTRIRGRQFGHASVCVDVQEYKLVGAIHAADSYALIVSLVFWEDVYSVISATGGFIHQWGSRHLVIMLSTSSTIWTGSSALCCQKVESKSLELWLSYLF